MNSPDRKKQVFVLWHEVMLIGIAAILIAAADKQQSVPDALSPVLQPINLSPDTTIKSPPVTKSA